MRIFALAIVLAVAAAYLRGGRLRNLASLRLRYLWLLGAAALVHLGTAVTTHSIFGGGGRFAALMTAYALVALWLVLNWRLAAAGIRFGLGLIAVGWLLNFVVIAANRGMPVSAAAMRRAGLHVGNLAHGNLYKHVPMVSGTRLHFLGDAIPVIPLGIVVSAGDIVLALGLALLVYSGLRMKSQASPGDPAAAASRTHGSGTAGNETTPSWLRISSLSRPRSSDAE